jgi:hypothetical protein
MSLKSVLLFAVCAVIAALPLFGQPKAPATFVYTADGVSSQVSGFSVAGSGTLTPVPGSPYTLPAEFPVTVTPTSLAYIAPYLVVDAANPNTATGMSVFKVDNRGAHGDSKWSSAYNFCRLRDDGRQSADTNGLCNRRKQ